MRRFVALLALAVLALSAGATADDHGITVQVLDHFVGLYVEGLSAFRISVTYDHTLVASLNDRLVTPLVDTHTTYAAYQVIQDGKWIGIKTAFGSAEVETTTGAFVLQDAAGKNITYTANLSKKGTFFADPTQADRWERDQAAGVTANEKKNDTCVDVYPGNDAVGGRRTPGCPNGLANQTQASCCAACNTDPDCTLWVYSTSGPDQGKNCWLLMNVLHLAPNGGRTSGGATLPGPAAVWLYLGLNAGENYYGSGGRAGSPLVQTQANAYVQNTEFFTSYYWSTGGYSQLAVSSLNYDPSRQNAYPVSWSQQSPQTRIQIAGARVDLYLMPAATPYDGTRVLHELVGRPAVLPRYAHGFLACRWGWTDRAYIAGVLTQFRSGNYPIDAWISDFEWYTPEPDYSLPVTGSPTFKDFTYNSITFPSPVEQLTEYHTKYNVRFGGIRKPRLGNSQLLIDAKSKGWLLVGSRDLNYSSIEVQTWYQRNLKGLLQDGVDFWWNDEGEGQYFTFHWWTLAQQAGIAEFNPRRRHFTINRAYSPGVSRLGGATWTGDIGVSWGALAQTPTYLLNWAMAGVGYVTCDIGGFNGPDDTPELLTRWYQMGVFMSIMRVHSTNSDKPHFPFLYGEPAGTYMRNALNLRYRLLPLTYSLAHEQYLNGRPILRPLLMEFANDTTAVKITSQVLLGSHLMAAPVLQEDNSVQVYLPVGVWYEWLSPVTHKGPTTLSLSGVSLDKLPMYVRAGGIIPLGPVLQYTDSLPGGPLSVHVYAGTNAFFTLFEDDGGSLDYANAPATSVRRTALRWVDGTRTLSWTVTGSFTAATIYTQLQLFAYFPDGTTKQSAVTPISGSGSITV